MFSLPSHPWRVRAFTLIVWCAVAGVTAANTAIEPVPRDAQWMRRHEDFVALARGGGIDVLFLGDSITDFWRLNRCRYDQWDFLAGRAVWEKNFSHLRAANFGIGADRTQHVLWRIQHGELDGLDPKVVVLLIGTNNTGLDRNTAAEATQGIFAVVTNLRANLPRATILLHALFPRGTPENPLRAKIREINAALALLDDGRSIRFVDFGPLFLAPDGTIPPELMPDLLHPSEQGYERWAAALREPLDRLLRN